MLEISPSLLETNTFVLLSLSIQCFTELRTVLSFWTMSTPVTISYNDLLKSDTTPLHGAINAAFGSSDDALGIILVNDLPDQWPELREKAMRAAARFAQDTPEEVRNKYTDPVSSYSFGWSHGKGDCISCAAALF